MKRFLLPFVAVICIAIMPLAACAQITREVQDAMRRAAIEAKQQEVMEKIDAPFSYYGKVLDQNNTPVEGARVEIHTTHYSPIFHRLVVTTIYAATDAKGRFSVENVKAHRLFVQGIAKPGYEYILEQNTAQDSYDARYEPARSRLPTPANPTVFRLRKRGATTLLIETSQSELLNFRSARVRWAAYVRDLINQEGRWMSKLKDRPFEHFDYDIKFEGTFDESLTTCTIVLTASGGGGIQASDRMMYEAPEKGYKDAVSFIARDGEPPKENYLYVKSRNPPIYSRVSISSISLGDGTCYVRYETATNPSGERILDSAAGVPAPVILGFRDEVTKAFRKGRRPAPPDVPKLIQAHKEGKLDQALAELRPK